jgi:predicted nucleic acid-binding protein
VGEQWAALKMCSATMTKLVLDTNVYIGWLKGGSHEPLVMGPGFVRFLSSIVQMELRTGAVTRRARQLLDQLVRAHAVSGRLVAPSPAQFDEAGLTLRALRLAGREIRRASLVNDVLIALTARQLGATVCTGDVEDFEAIRRIRNFSLRAVPPLLG